MPAEIVDGEPGVFLGDDDQACGGVRGMHPDGRVVAVGVAPASSSKSAGVSTEAPTDGMAGAAELDERACARLAPRPRRRADDPTKRTMPTRFEACFHPPETRRCEESRVSPVKASCVGNKCRVRQDASRNMEAQPRGLERKPRYELLQSSRALGRAIDTAAARHVQRVASLGLG